MTSWICSKKIRNHLRPISEHHSSPNPSAGAMLPSQVKKQSCKKVRDCKYLSEAKNVSELFVLSEIKNSNLKSLFAQEAQVVDVFAPGPEVQTEKWFTSLNAFNNLRFRAFLCEFSKWVPLRYFLLFFACGFCGWNRPGICYEAKSGKIKSILRLVRQMRRFTRPNVLSNVYIQHSVHHFAFFLYFVRHKQKQYILTHATYINRCIVLRIFGQALCSIVYFEALRPKITWDWRGEAIGRDPVPTLGYDASSWLSSSSLSSSLSSSSSSSYTTDEVGGIP